MYPSTRTGQKPADTSRRASHHQGAVAAPSTLAKTQTPRKKPSSPLTSSALFIDGEYVQMQTSARGRGRKVGANGYSKPWRSTSTQGQWLQGRYKSMLGDKEPPHDRISGPTSRNSKFFKSADTVLAPNEAKRPQNALASRKRPSGKPGVRYAPTQVYEIPQHLGGFAIRRLKAPGKRKQQAARSQETVSPRMHRGAPPGGSLGKDGVEGV